MVGNRKSARALCGVVGLAMGLLTMNPAYAGGMWNLDQGASHYGRGGANIAAPKDPSGAYVNPAALAGLKGLHFMLGGNYNWDNRTFARASDNEGLEGAERMFESASNLEKPSPSPNIFAAYNFAGLGVESIAPLTLGIGLWGPPKTNRQYDSEGSQRYSSIHARDVQAHYVMSAAYQLGWRNLRLGASLGGTSVLVDSSLKFNVYELRRQYGELFFPQDKEYADWDLQATLSGADHGIPMTTLALSLELWKNSTLAIAYQHSFDVNAKGVLKMDTGKGFDNPLVMPSIGEFVEGEDITIGLNLPPVVRIALNHQFSRGAIELACVWEGWSRTEETVITPDNIRFNVAALPDPIELPVIHKRTEFRDTGSVRFGGEYQVAQRLLVRGGAYYERAGVGGGRLTPSEFDLDKVGLTHGGRFEMGAGLYLDVAVGVAYWVPKTVTRSKVLFRDPAPVESVEIDPWALANGTYSNTQIFSMVALGGQFDI